MSAGMAALAGDGSAKHLKRGMRMPDIALTTTAGRARGSAVACRSLDARFDAGARICPCRFHHRRGDARERNLRASRPGRLGFAGHGPRVDRVDVDEAARRRTLGERAEKAHRLALGGLGWSVSHLTTPLVMGFLADRYGIVTGFYALGFVALLCAVAIAFLRRWAFRQP